MAFAATLSTKESRKFSMGPENTEIFTWTAASGDTSGTVTSLSLTTIDHILMDGGLVLSAAPTFSSGVATLAFVNPAATVFGTLLLIGK